jgi:Bacterial aa3 type cytochrome c oxidase subunit IV
MESLLNRAGLKRHLPLHRRPPFTDTDCLLTGNLHGLRQRSPPLPALGVSPIMASNEQQNDNHRSTYESFTGFTKWGTIFVITIMLALYVFLV